MAGISAYFNLFIAGELNSSRTHAILLSVSIGSEFLVAGGILLETHWPRRWKEWLAAIFIVGGVFFGAIVTVSLFVFDEGISKTQQFKIDAQQLKIITLETQLFPRNLPLDAQKRVADKVCPFGPQSFNEIKVSTTDEIFMGEMENIWKQCDWKPVGLPNRDEVSATVATSVGINLLFDSSEQNAKDASMAFRDGLKAEGIAASADPMPEKINTHTAAIYIIYGSRPLNIFSASP